MVTSFRWWRAGAGALHHIFFDLLTGEIEQRGVAGPVVPDMRHDFVVNIRAIVGFIAHDEHAEDAFGMGAIDAVELVGGALLLTPPHPRFADAVYVAEILAE